MFIVRSCDLLSEFSFVTVLSNYVPKLSTIASVVICFQSFLSLLFFQTSSQRWPCGQRLWFAFRVFFRYCSFKQGLPQYSNYYGCDLLSEFSFVTVLSNLWKSAIDYWLVVICFQSFLSLLFFQTCSCRYIVFRGCDLLSEFSFVTVLSNTERIIPVILAVVICFQSFLSLLFFQTNTCRSVIANELWFAFRVFFRYCSFKQIATGLYAFTCCDLLSEFSFVTVLSNAHW